MSDARRRGDVARFQQKSTRPFHFAISVCARGGSRTLMTLRSTDFESVASAIPPPGQKLNQLN